MNNYQKQLMERISSIKLISKTGEEGLARIDGNSLILRQNENYHITKYSLSIESTSIESIVINDKEYKSKANRIEAQIDFDEPVKKVTIRFKMDLADPLEFITKYEFADKAAYDVKDADMRRQNILEILKLKCRTGFDNAQLYWKSNPPKASKLTILLYAIIEDQDHVPMRYLMKEIKPANNEYYVSAIDLPYGHYSFLFTIEFDGGLNVEEEIGFTIANPFNRIEKKMDNLSGTVAASGKNTVCI